MTTGPEDEQSLVPKPKPSGDPVAQASLNKSATAELFLVLWLSSQFLTDTWNLIRGNNQSSMWYVLTDMFVIIGVLLLWPLVVDPLIHFFHSRIHAYQPRFEITRQFKRRVLGIVDQRIDIASVDSPLPPKQPPPPPKCDPPLPLPVPAVPPPKQQIQTSGQMQCMTQPPPQRPVVVTKTRPVQQLFPLQRQPLFWVG